MALRQVADTLAALCAAPTRAELSGEATIMAEFDAIAEFRPLGLSQAAPPYGMAHTLVLPVPPPGAPRRRGARHRNRRPAPSVSKRTAAILIAAAAALVVAAVAVTGNLPGLQKSNAPQSTAASSATHSGAGNSGSQGVQANRAATESPNRDRATPTDSAAVQPAKVPPQEELCRAVFGFFLQPEQGPDWRSKWATEIANLKKLEKLAGGPGKAGKFCAQYVRDMFPHGIPDSLGPGAHGLQQLGPVDPGQNAQDMKPHPPAQPPATNAAPANSNG